MSGAIGSFVIGASPIGGPSASPGSSQSYTPSAYLAPPAQTQPVPGTVVPFTPTQVAAFQFQATLDGQTYQVMVTWNVYRCAYYVNVYDQTQTRVFSLPLIPSPDDYAISLTAGYFSSTMIFRDSTQSFEIAP